MRSSYIGGLTYSQLQVAKDYGFILSPPKMPNSRRKLLEYFHIDKNTGAKNY